MKLKELEAPTAIVSHPEIEGLSVELSEPDVETAVTFFADMSTLKEGDAPKRIEMIRTILAKHVVRVIGLPLKDGKRADIEGPFDMDDVKVLESVRFAIPRSFVGDDGKEVHTFERFTDILRAKLTDVGTFNVPLGEQVTRSTASSSVK